LPAAKCVSKQTLAVPFFSTKRITARVGVREKKPKKKPNKKLKPIHHFSVDAQKKRASPPKFWAKFVLVRHTILAPKTL
jgi:UDP-N-acetylmuramyl pentapeptide phosphotransferase/UDP-N-acetylglucosamine-1-phosphate transferase